MKKFFLYKHIKKKQFKFFDITHDVSEPTVIYKLIKFLMIFKVFDVKKTFKADSYQLR